MKLPFLDLQPTYAASREAIDAALLRVAASGWFVMGRELEAEGIAVVSLWPGIVKTERLLTDDRLGFDLTHSESPLLSGRAVAALAADAAILTKTGKPHVVAELAAAYGFTEPDGTLPSSLRR